MKQWDKTNSLFMVAKGECEVTIIDEKKNTSKPKILRPS